MKQNKYDHPAFFEKYSQFGRSVHGLAAAGEWHELKKLLPGFEGKRVLDLGCGFGWHCRYAVEQGAAYVLGVDISAKMLERARELTPTPLVEYSRAAIEDIALAPGSFNVVISSLALHYIEPLEAIYRKVRDCLAPGGSFVFSVEHPVFTAHGAQDWQYTADGDRLHWPVDRYFDEGLRDTVFLGERVVKYHKTLTSYVNSLIKAGFLIEALVEPTPEPGMMAADDGMRDELRRPMMLLVSAKAV